MLTFIHAADFHLDSAFGALDQRRSAARRRESRETALRLSNYVNSQGVDLVLLAGDLFDSAAAFRETGEQLSAALGQMEAQVFIAPGNHDWYGPGSPWRTVDWPENVHIFSENALTAVELPEWNLVVHGAAFTGPEQAESALRGFTAPDDGLVHIGLIHGELTGSESRYRPLTTAAVAASGLHYLALGHVHGCSGVLRAGTVSYGYCGCLEGRGFDELGDKGFLAGEVSPEGAARQFIPFARRRYRIMEVDVTEGDPAETALAAIPQGWGEDVCRIVLTGSPAAPVRPERIETALAGRFYALQVRDKTTARQELWERCGEDTLRGLFLRNLRDRCGDDPQSRRLMEQAAAFGLAAIDDREV